MVRNDYEKPRGLFFAGLWCFVPLTAFDGHRGVVCVGKSRWLAGKTGAT